jgi:streptogramin lyase
MAILTEWPLPLNPPSFRATHLRFLTPALNDRLYYTKYIVDYIGELTINQRQANLREWKIPAGLALGPSGNARGIVHGPDGKGVWFALENGCRLIELDPASGQFTAYGGATLLPIAYPRHLMFDGKGALWFTGCHQKGAMVGRLAPNRASATFWTLPNALLYPESIWVDDAGTTIWFTPIGGAVTTGAFLARLFPISGQLTLWTYPGPGRRAANAGVVAEPRVKPENVWFTYDAQGPASRVFRLHIGSGTMFEYSPTFGSPWYIAIDQDRNAWISDRLGRVSRIAKDDDCGQITLPKRSMKITSKTLAVRMFGERVNPVVTTTAPVAQPVNPQVDGCYLHFSSPSQWSSPLGIAVADRPGGPDVYFSDAGLNRIALLAP